MPTTNKNDLQRLLDDHLRRANAVATAKLEATLHAFSTSPSRAEYFKMFALAPRWYGKHTTAPTAHESEALSALHPDLGGTPWSDDQFARLSMLLAAQAVWPRRRFAEELETLFNTGDIRELVMLYRSLALLQEPQQFLARAREGTRSNMVDVFQAIAHHNSYPLQYFDQASWNQLVLKSVFIDCPLWPITGLEARNNPELAHMLGDYVRERWAAQRTVPWEIWRCIGSHAQQPEDLDLLAQALNADAALTRTAAAMALRDRKIAGANALRERHQSAIRQLGDRDWQQLANQQKG